jgi:choline dehydrogenase
MFDTIIIGAGTAGCVLANRLSADPARKVLLLEAGGEVPINSKIPSDWVTLFNSSADWAFSTVAQDGCRGRRIFWPRGKMIGGSGAMNAMIYIRGLPYDFDQWESELGCIGWGWQSMLQEFIATENNIDHADEPLHGTGGQMHIQHAAYQHEWEKAWIAAGVNAGYPANSDFNGASQEGFGSFQFFIKDGRRAGTGRMYLEPALERQNLTVIKHVHVTGLDVSGGRVRAVNYLLNGAPQRAEAASEVVMSAGTLGTTQILQLSGIGRAADLEGVGVKPVVDTAELGYNLQDHINVAISFYSKEPGGIGAWDAEFLDASFKEWEALGTGPRSTPWVAAGAHVRSRPGIEPDLQFYGAASPHRDYARFLAGKSGMTMHSTLQRPLSRGELRLRSANPIDSLDIDPKYFSSDQTRWRDAALC